MKWVLIPLLALLTGLGSAQVTWTARNLPTILTARGATPTERLAARELAAHLSQMLRANVAVREFRDDEPPRPIYVGLASRWGVGADLGPEDVLMQTQGDKLMLVGGGPRGVIYAVNRFLHRQGVRWWTPWATHVPERRTIRVPKLDLVERPTFESRDPFWFHAFDRDWARRNGSNSMHARLTEEDGGKIVYSGFVHTFYPLVPPAEHFDRHPEWFSLVGGTRRREGAQLCTTNPELRAFLIDRVKAQLRANPAARIVSVSQNDWYGACECPTCKALDEAEGSQAATVLDLANAVGDAIRDEFPLVAVDTLAYQYTRRAPKSLRPRPNVIVRLCSIECDFSKPLTDPANADFARDIRDWSRLTQRLYVWNYVTCFPNYVMPFPNYDVIGPNQRFFAANGVKGLFEQGAYQSFGASMAEMQAWVQAQLLWNPNQDDRALREEFLRGYYGAAAKPISAALDRLAKSARPHPMNIWVGPGAPFFDAKTVLDAEKLWQAAARAVGRDPERLRRVRVGHLGLRTVILSRWAALRREAKDWPLPASRKAVADDWIRVALGPGPKGWSPITHMNESGLRPERWIERFAVDPEPVILPKRTGGSALPADLTVPPGAIVETIQDDLARLYAEGDLVEIRPDPLASDGIAARLRGEHREWAVQFVLPERAQTGTWRVYAAIRVEAGADPKAVAYTAGIWDGPNARSLGQVSMTNEGAGTGYRTVLLGTVNANPQAYVWIAPANGGSRSVWVDRLLLVKIP